MFLGYFIVSSVNYYYNSKILKITDMWRNFIDILKTIIITNRFLAFIQFHKHLLNNCECQILSKFLNLLSGEKKIIKIPAKELHVKPWFRARIVIKSLSFLKNTFANNFHVVSLC